MAALQWVPVLLAAVGCITPAAGHVCAWPCSCRQLHASMDVHLVDCSRRRLASGFFSAQDWPPALQGGSSGAIVDFRQNNIKTVGRFPKLPSVLSLSLRRNQVQVIEEGAFANLENLELLDLSHNKLTGTQIRSDIFSASPNISDSKSPGLSSLDLGYNNISYLDANSLENIRNLQELRLNNNPLFSLEKSIQEALGSLNSLQVLDLSFTGISSVDDKCFQTPSIKGSLRELHLNGNQLTEVPKGSSVVGSTLEMLYLNGNPIPELNDTSFFGLRNIRQLSISEMGSLFRIAPGAFDSLERLQILSCSSNPRLNDIDKDAFRELKNKWPVKEVYLNNNGLESVSPELLPWDKVDVLDIRDNPWCCDCRMSWFPRLLGPIMSAGMPMIGQRTYCVKPPRWSGVSLLHVPADEESWCSDEAAAGHASRGTTASFVVLGIAIPLLSALAVGMICARRKHMLSYVQPLNQPYLMIQR